MHRHLAPSPPRIHVVRFTDARGGAPTSHLSETAIGEGATEFPSALRSSDTNRKERQPTAAISLAGIVSSSANAIGSASC